MTKKSCRFVFALILFSSSLLAQNSEIPRYTSVDINTSSGKATVTVKESLEGRFSEVQVRPYNPFSRLQTLRWTTLSANDAGDYVIVGEGKEERGHFEIRFSYMSSETNSQVAIVPHRITLWRQRIYIPFPSDTDIEILAEKHLPIPIFNKDEEYFPVSLDQIVDFGETNGGETDRKEVPVSQITSTGPAAVGAGEELRTFLAHNGHVDHTIVFDQDDVRCPRTDEGQEGDCSPVFYRQLKGEKQNITVYYDASLEGGSLYLTYYYFYAFDPKVEGDKPRNDDGELVDLNAFSHVYDRESVTIRLDREEETGPWSPSFVYYAAHLENQDMEFNGCIDFTRCDGPAESDGNDEEYIIWGGGKTSIAWNRALKVANHPVIYLARGSHAVLPAAGWYTVRTKKVIQGLNEPAGGIGDTALVIPQASMALEELDYSRYPLLSFSGSWIYRALPVIADIRGYFPPFIRTPYGQWTRESESSFSNCISDQSPSNDCKEVRKYFQTERIRGLENHAAVTLRVLEPVDESVHFVQYQPLGNASIRVYKNENLLDETSIGEYSLIVEPDSSSSYTYEIQAEGYPPVVGKLSNVESGFIGDHDIFLGGLDRDGDGAPDAEDAFPDDPAEQSDTDGDGVGNNADIDDDGDSVPDVFDAFPLVETEWSDYNSNGVGDNADPPEGTATVHVEVVSTDALNIYWSMPDGYSATSFEIYRNEVLLLGTEKSSLIDRGLDVDTYYCYSVVATYSSGELSPPSSLSCGKTNSTLVPVGVTASAGNAQATINWDPVVGASAYAVYWSNETDVPLASRKRIKVTSDTYLHDGLINNQSYFYVVTSVVDGLESTESAEVMAAPRSSALLNKFVFGTQRDRNWEIYSADAPSGDNMVNLTMNPADDQLATIAPTLDRIAFVSDRDANREVYAMEVDGSAQTRFTDNIADDAPSAWSPDASELLALSNRDNNLEIYKFSENGELLNRLTENTADDTLATWAPDGSRILYVSEVDGNPEVYTMLPNGEDKRNLTNHSADDNIPFYSPDGRQITFVSDRDGDYDLWIMNADGTNLRKLTGDEIDEVGWYAWSPDGSRIVYDSRADGDYEVYMISGNGTIYTQLTDNDFADQFASWTLDGKSILFTTDRDGNSEIYIVDADGGVAVNLTNDPSDDFIPVFSPVYGTVNCFIATAAYGSFLHEDIQVLRRFRDDQLMKSYIGRSFVDFYYDVSPPLAAYIAEREWARAVTRILLAPIVFFIKHPFGAAFLAFALFGAGRFAIRRIRLARSFDANRATAAG